MIEQSPREKWTTLSHGSAEATSLSPVGADDESFILVVSPGSASCSRLTKLGGRSIESVTTARDGLSAVRSH